MDKINFTQIYFVKVNYYIIKIVIINGKFINLTFMALINIKYYPKRIKEFKKILNKLVLQLILIIINKFISC